MNPESSAPPLENNAEQAPLIGLAKIMRMIFSGIDLTPLGTQLVARAEKGSGKVDANAFMDLFTILLLRGNRELALTMQAQALALQQIYSLPSTTGRAAVRVLALMGAGDLMANSPLELLLENSDVALDMLYVTPQRPLPLALPDHDVLFVAISESDENMSLLQELAGAIKSWPHPVLNLPGRIALLSRDSACALLKSAPGVIMPDTARISRQTLEQIGREELAVPAVLADGPVIVNEKSPLIARPVDSHAGQGLVKLETGRTPHHQHHFVQGARLLRFRQRAAENLLHAGRVDMTDRLAGHPDAINPEHAPVGILDRNRLDRLREKFEPAVREKNILVRKHHHGRCRGPDSRVIGLPG